jgi:hypothetical protein
MRTRRVRELSGHRNLKDFPAEWGSTKVVTARQFLDAVV